MAEKLPLVGVVRAAVLSLWEEKATVFKLIALASVFVTLFEWLTVELYARDWRGGLFFLGVLRVGVYTCLAVAIHRLVLQVDMKFSVKPFLGVWSGREFRFLGWLVVVYFYLTIVLLAAAGVTSVLGGFGPWADSLPTLILLFLGVLISLPAAFLFVRLSVLLPATAIDQRRNMAWAWELTEGNGWRLVVLLWLLPMFLKYASPEFEFVKPVALLAFNAVLSLVVAIEIAVLSAAFGLLGGTSTDALNDEAVV